MITPASTDLLISPPNIPDPRFRNSVLMLTHDHEGGSFALCVNRETRYTVKDLLEDSNLEVTLNFPVYWGGPVGANTVWMLHSSEWSAENTVEIDDEWSMTSSVEMFRLLSQGDCPRHFRIMFGYCSWAPGQLQRELDGEAPWKKEHSWLVAKNLGPEWLFEQPLEEVWNNCTTLSSHQAVDSWL